MIEAPPSLNPALASLPQDIKQKLERMLAMAIYQEWEQDTEDGQTDEPLHPPPDARSRRPKRPRWYMPNARRAKRPRYFMYY